MKLKSDGSLDKLKCRIVVQGDLQEMILNEDKWSPTASFRAMQMFLAGATRLKVRVRQLDFIGTYLQSKAHGRIFVRMLAIYGELWPEFKAYSEAEYNQCCLACMATSHLRMFLDELEGIPPDSPR